jgi:pectinesterase
MYSGTYSEQVTIPSRAAALTIYGYTTDTTSYTSNVVTITHSSSLLSGAANDEATGTVINEAANTKFYNINIKNTPGTCSQAIALAAYSKSRLLLGHTFFMTCLGKKTLAHSLLQTHNKDTMA